jgi:hypothetical protein
MAFAVVEAGKANPKSIYRPLERAARTPEHRLEQNFLFWKASALLVRPFKWLNQSHLIIYGNPLYLESTDYGL